MHMCVVVDDVVACMVIVTLQLIVVRYGRGGSELKVFLSVFSVFLVW